MKEAPLQSENIRQMASGFMICLGTFTTGALMGIDGITIKTVLGTIPKGQKEATVLRGAGLGAESSTIYVVPAATISLCMLAHTLMWDFAAPTRCYRMRSLPRTGHQTAWLIPHPSDGISRKVAS